MEDWVEVMHNIHTMEKLIFSLRLESENLNRFLEKLD